MRIHIVVDVPEQLLLDVLTTAVEGGINYWADFVSVSRLQPDLSVNNVRLRPREEDAELAVDDEVFQITHLRIGQAMQLVVSGDVLVRDDIRRAVLHAIADPDNADIDAEAADVLVQVACFGEIVYG